jgi:hypothetical protein
MFYTEIESYVYAKYLYYASLPLTFSMYSTGICMPCMTQEACESFVFISKLD